MGCGRWEQQPAQGGSHQRGRGACRGKVGSGIRSSGHGRHGEHASGQPPRLYRPFPPRLLIRYSRALPPSWSSGGGYTAVEWTGGRRWLGYGGGDEDSRTHGRQIQVDFTRAPTKFSNLRNSGQFRLFSSRCEGAHQEMRLLYSIWDLRDTVAYKLHKAWTSVRQCSKSILGPGWKSRFTDLAGSPLSLTTATQRCFTQARGGSRPSTVKCFRVMPVFVTQDLQMRTVKIAHQRARKCLRLSILTQSKSCIEAQLASNQAASRHRPRRGARNAHQRRLSAPEGVIS